MNMRRPLGVVALDGQERGVERLLDACASYRWSALTGTTWSPTCR